MDLNQAQALLGLSPGADRSSAMTAFKVRAQMLHPDKHVTASAEVRAEATRAMQQLNEALEVLLAHLDGKAPREGSVSPHQGEGTKPPAEEPTAEAPPPPPKPPQPPAQRRPNDSECALCGATPVARERVGSVASYVVWVRVTTVEEALCRNCGLSVFRDYQAKTLVRGWWSPLGALRSLWILGRNLLARQAFVLLPASRRPLPEVVAPIPYGAVQARPVLARPMPILMTALAAVVLTVLVVQNTAQQSGGSSDTSALTADTGGAPAATQAPAVSVQPPVQQSQVPLLAPAELPTTEPSPTATDASQYLVDLTNCGADLFDPVGFVCRYVAAINGQDWATVFYSQTAAKRAKTSQAQIAQSDDTTVDSDVYAGVKNTSSDANGPVYDVVVAFTSHQDAAYGPGGDTCDTWVLNYHLVTEGPGLRLQSSRSVPGYATHAAC